MIWFLNCNLINYFSGQKCKSSLEQWTVINVFKNVFKVKYGANNFIKSFRITLDTFPDFTEIEIQCCCVGNNPKSISKYHKINGRSEFCSFRNDRLVRHMQHVPDIFKSFLEPCYEALNKCFLSYNALFSNK